MKVTSVNDEIELLENAVVIRRRGVANAMASGVNGERFIELASITAIQFKAAGWMPGYILFSYAGSKPFRGGIMEATQDPDAFIFEKAKSEQMLQFKAALEDRRLKIKSRASATPISIASELERLSDLRDRGVLNADEFQAAKMKLIS